MRWRSTIPRHAGACRGRRPRRPALRFSARHPLSKVGFRSDSLYCSRLCDLHF